MMALKTIENYKPWIVHKSEGNPLYKWSCNEIAKGKVRELHNAIIDTFGIIRIGFNSITLDNATAIHLFLDEENHALMQLMYKKFDMHLTDTNNLWSICPQIPAIPWVALSLPDK